MQGLWENYDLIGSVTLAHRAGVTEKPQTHQRDREEDVFSSHRTQSAILELLFKSLLLMTHV